MATRHTEISKFVRFMIIGKYKPLKQKMRPSHWMFLNELIKKTHYFFKRQAIAVTEISPSQHNIPAPKSNVKKSYIHSPYCFKPYLDLFLMKLILCF